MTIDPLLLEARDEVIQCELLTSEDISLGILGRVLRGSIDFNVARVVRGGGSVTLNLSSDVEWESARIKISRGIRVPGEAAPRLWGCGVFRALVGDEDWSAEGATVSATLLDKTSFLDELQLDHTYTLPVGYTVTKAIRELVLEAGEKRFSITDSDRALSAPMSWNPGTSYLKIINELLDTIGYFSMWADGDGYLRADPYTPPADRPVAFHFRNDTRSIVTPDFKLLQAPYKVPNKIIGTSRVEGEAPQLLSVATNENEHSPYSYQARKNTWRTETLADVDAATQEALDEIVLRRLISVTSAARGVEFEHGWLPLNLNDVVGWTNTRADVDMYGTLVAWDMELTEGALVKSKVTEVVSL